MRGRNKGDQDNTYSLSVKMTASTQAEERDGKVDVDRTWSQVCSFFLSFQPEDI